MNDVDICRLCMENKDLLNVKSKTKTCLLYLTAETKKDILIAMNVPR